MCVDRRLDGWTVRQLVLWASTVLLTVYPSNRLFAQCPDGSLPPCRSAPPVPIDSNLLVIFPFIVTGPAEVRYLGDGVPALLNYSLDGVADWRVASPQSVRRRVSGLTQPVSPGALSGVARTLGAGTMVIGSTVTIGHTLQIHAELYDTRRAQPLATINARSDLMLANAAVDSVVVGLVRERLQRHPTAGPRPVSEYATQSPEALRLFLKAVHLQREYQWQASVDTLLAAIRDDSTFGLAYYRLYVASTHGELGIQLPPDWGSLQIVQRALRQSDRLTRRTRDILEAVLAQQEDRRFDAVAMADELAKRYPDDAEVAYLQGESGWHFGLSLGVPLGGPLAAFERALALDSASRDGRGHLVSLLLINGDTARAAAIAMSPGEQLWVQIVKMAQTEADPAVLARQVAVKDLGSLDEPIIQPLLLLDRTPARAVAFADSVSAVLASRVDLPPDARAWVMLRRSQLQYARGRYEDARSFVTAAESLSPGSASGAAMISPLGTVLLGREGDRAAGRMAEAGRNRPLIQLQIAWYAAETGDSSRLASATHTVDSMRASGRLFPGWLTARLAGIRGIMALRQGDSVSAREQLQTSYARAPYFQDLLSTMRARIALLLARLDLAAGAVPLAQQRLFDTFWLGFEYRAEAEELRGQINEQQHDTAAAIRGYRNFVELWKDADAELQPRVAAAREALARLER